MNKDLILREKLAIQRTHLANQTTFLAFLRTAMYFFVAGLSIDSFFSFSESHLIMWIFFVISAGLIAFGIFNFLINRKSIVESEEHIGDYQTEYLKKS
ncbi:DUF202 domain-containing protein [Sphingobacterium alkalisoli]|uniref:DUF202 domain-containing protein n=1 Tax=Sphingobacterium alkalisoli TaxID=1874115 RepID=A0A4U0GUP9_9SPHI|nr:DUF202 domain-containing protein [Sphingobacterium alkalisoli]TJY61442.1 DUF202 domain-containing protein [Sphingobacterium alkalisoli]GGH30369.1 hypothetical protein GCM10011418_42350 [Sphingobacterium alkalisoli]